MENKKNQLKDDAGAENAYLLKQISRFFHTGIYRLRDGELISYEESPEYNPLYASRDFLKEMCGRADGQEVPVLWVDESRIYFATMKTDCGEYVFIGPMATRHMQRAERHRFYHKYGVEEKWEKGLHYHILTEILEMVSFVTKLATGHEYTGEQIAEANPLPVLSREQEKEELILYDLKEEDEDIYRHTYQDERNILDMVREGNVSEVIRLSDGMDPDIGWLGKTELLHWRNLLTVSVTLCARAAIESGLSPSVAYRISGFYIYQGSDCTEIPQLLAYRDHAISELARRVGDLKNRKHTSSYTEQCKDFVSKHYREKIYLDKIAESMGISSSYLSRIFKKETGMRFQDYITEVRLERATNLLIYSEEPLSRIAEYVNFPSQSYFGRIFKEKTGMTPRQYRERNKPTEFSEGVE